MMPHVDAFPVDEPECGAWSKINKAEQLVDTEGLTVETDAPDWPCTTGDEHRKLFGNEIRQPT